MPRLNSNVSTFLIAAFVAGGVLTAGLMERYRDNPDDLYAILPSFGSSAHAQDAEKDEAPRIRWAASATGRIEPVSGTVQVMSRVAGPIEEVLVTTNDEVKKGDLLVVLDEADALERIDVATAEVEVREGERAEEEAPTGLALERQEAEDAVYEAEREVFQAWRKFDAAFKSARTSSGRQQEVNNARDRIASLEAKLSAKRAELDRINDNPDLPAPTRLESSLSIARAELAMAENAFERTRIRAPFDGTVLNVFARRGENAAPSAGQPLLMFGDLATLRVRAEVEERDVAKVRVGQKVVVRADAFPDREFKGVVTEVASALGRPRITSRGPRRPNDVDVLEVVADLEGSPPLLTGMRVDVFFKPTGKTAQNAQPE